MVNLAENQIPINSMLVDVVMTVAVLAESTLDVVIFVALAANVEDEPGN